MIDRVGTGVKIPTSYIAAIHAHPVVNRETVNGTQKEYINFLRNGSCHPISSMLASS